MGRYDIAITGMGCVFPSANSVEQYWKNIESGETFFKKMPEELWRMENYYSPDRTVADKSYTMFGAFIEGFEFPFSEYRLPPNTMRGVDPAQLVSLEATREALADAGIEPRSEALHDAITIIGSSGVDAFAHSTIYLRRHAFLSRIRPMLEARGVPAEKIDELFEQFASELSARGHVWTGEVRSNTVTVRIVKAGGAAPRAPALERRGNLAP